MLFPYLKLPHVKLNISAKYGLRNYSVLKY